MEDAGGPDSAEPPADSAQQARPTPKRGKTARRQSRPEPTTPEPARHEPHPAPGAPDAARHELRPTPGAPDAARQSPHPALEAAQRQAHSAPGRSEPAHPAPAAKPWVVPKAWSAQAVEPPRQPAPETTALAEPLGALTMSGGASYPLDRPYVLGRDPMADEAVRRAAASPIALTGDRHISRVHARVFIEGTAVFVQDAATPGGTYIAAPRAEDWIRLGAQPMELKPGWSLRIADRILTYSTEALRPQRR
ncbi:FHA domain-containing protein [Nocardia otitidiscaviarum]|nr:FHA domain-containing protein [Nocardia otitidiscaviarum]MCP9620282.1 FHA domain-containing protein [Nocardia otitidiscaviarum]